MTDLERVARAICLQLGYEWDTLYGNKQEWIDDRGKRHDINTPFRPWFMDAARAALEALMEQSDGPLQELVNSTALDCCYVSSTDHAKHVVRVYLSAVLEGK